MALALKSDWTSHAISCTVMHILCFAALTHHAVITVDSK